jgi:hypothetical protein
MNVLMRAIVTLKYEGLPATMLQNPFYRLQRTEPVEHIVFHHNGKEYTVYAALTADEIKTIMVMEEERSRKLDALNKKSVKRYFEDTDKMVTIILRRCFRMTDNQISGIEEAERRNLAHSFIHFIAVANNFSGSR